MTEWAAGWAGRDARLPTPTMAALHGVTRTTRSDCRDDAKVQMLVVGGLGHTWWGGANDTMWGSFARHSPPG